MQLVYRSSSSLGQVLSPFIEKSQRIGVGFSTYRAGVAVQCCHARRRGSGDAVVLTTAAA
jgi:hypothetical protein